MNKSLLLGWLSTTVLLLSVSPVWAQSSAKEEAVPQLPSVLERKVYEPEALVSGAAYGDAWVEYNDNIFRSPNNEESDFIGVVNPGFNIRTNMDQHSLSLTSELEYGKFFSNSENDYVDAEIGAKGRYDFSPFTALHGWGLFESNHVGIGSFIDEPGAAATEPTDYRYYEVGTQLVSDQDRWHFELGPKVEFYNYDNVNRLGGGRIINDDRDRRHIVVTGRVGNYVTPDTMVYVKGVVNTRDYDKQIDGTVLNGRDSNGYEALIGTEIGDRKQPLWVDVNIGYLEQDYDDPMLPTVDGFAFNGDARWQATDQLSFRGLLSRSVEENTLTGASGYLRSRVGAGAEYDFFNNWVVGGDVRYTHYDFEFNPSLSGGRSREDDIVDGSLQAYYFFTENYSVGMEYQHVNRDSTDPLADYNSNSVLLRVAFDY